MRPVHTLSLRSAPKTDSEIESESEENRQTTKLKRRWSLLIPKLRRRSHVNDTRGESQSPVRSSEPFFSRLTRNRQSLPPESRIARSDYASTSQQKQQKPSESLPSSVHSGDENDSTSVREVYLITPSERAALLASLYSPPRLVDINVTGRNFDRLSSTRRSLIHVRFAFNSIFFFFFF